MKTRIETKQEAIEDILLSFAMLFNELSTSDLQAVAYSVAKTIINLIQDKP